MHALMRQVPARLLPMVVGIVFTQPRPEADVIQSAPISIEPEFHQWIFDWAPTSIHLLILVVAELTVDMVHHWRVLVLRAE